MEHWNMENEREKMLAYFLNIDVKYRGKTYTLTDIINELNLESVTGEMPEEERKALADKDNRSWYTNNLNKMFGTLFDCKYQEVLVRKGREYIIKEEGRNFLKFLWSSYGAKEGKKLVSKKYKDVDIQYECYLFYHATEFLKELGKQDEKKKEMGKALAGTLMQKFDVDKGTCNLMKSVAAFNQMIENILEDDALESEQKNIMHGKMAKEIDKLFSIILWTYQR